MSGKEMCQVCCENFSKSRKKIECPYCKYTCCKYCIQNYIINHEFDNCMNCRKSFSFEFISKHLNKTYLQKEYKNHKKQLLLNTEISKIPSTLPLLEHKNETQRIHKILYEKHFLINKIKNEIKEINFELSVHLNKDINNTKKEFKLPCPKDKCKGFLNSKYICAVCNTKACSKCREIIINKETHICDEELVKNIELIKKENRACPKCAISIYKISGCDQMWCTQCNVAFSWKTGKITNGPIHNPHFYQAQQLLGQNLHNENDEINCNNLINNYQYRVFTSNFIKFKSYYKKSNNENNSKLKIIDIMNIIFCKLHRATLHNLIIMEELDNSITLLNNNDELRIKYMTDEYNSSKFTQLVYNRYNKLNKKIKLREVFEMYLNVIKETINNLYLELKNKKIEYITEFKKNKIIEYYERIIKISNYTNENFKKIGISFNNTLTYQIKYNWEIIENHSDSFGLPFKMDKI